MASPLERNGAATGHVEEPDDVAVVGDRLPPEQHLHALEQRADAAWTLVGHRLVAADREREFFVLGADAEARLRHDARGEPGDEVVARLDRCHVDFVAGHVGNPSGKGARPYTRPPRKGNQGREIARAAPRTDSNGTKA